MTRLAVALPEGYPRQYVWWMECDFCHQSRSRPAWQQQDLPLSDFTALGWDCGKVSDACPACVPFMQATPGAGSDD